MMTDSIKNWYRATYPTDSLGAEINPKAVFSRVIGVILNGKDIYDYIGVGDSLVRERVFNEVAVRQNLPYNYVYNLWMRH